VGIDVPEEIEAKRMRRSYPGEFEKVLAEEPRGLPVISDKDQPVLLVGRGGACRKL